MCLISIVIPIYNEVKNFSYCLNSISEQTLFKSKEIEIIVIDDFSEPEKSAEIESVITDFKKLYESDIVFIKNNKNLGSGESRNIGIKKSKGEFIYFLDDDDYIPSKKVLEHLIMKAEKNKEINVIVEV